MPASGPPSRDSKDTKDIGSKDRAPGAASQNADDGRQHVDEPALSPAGVCDALYRTARETCHQRDRRARLIRMHAPLWELAAAEALVDTCDLALEEAIAEFGKCWSENPQFGAAEQRKAANTLWLAARDYIRRMSIASQAARQINQQHDADALSGLRMEYELEASSLLALKQAVNAYTASRPEADS